MKKFFIAVIILVTAAIVGYVISYVARPVNSIALEEYDHEISVFCENAYIVRNETVYYAPAAGTVYNPASEGGRVSRDMVISTIYNGAVGSDALRELRTIDDSISRVKANESDSMLYKTDEASVENEISARMNGIFELAENNNIEQIHDYKNEINNLRSGDSDTDTSRLTALTEERDNLESSISDGKTDIVSDRSGIFSSYVDGLESVLTPENIKSYDAAYIKSLETSERHLESGSSAAIGDAVCKVMNNHIWYILGITDAEHAAILGSCSSVKARFTNLSGITVKGTVEYISDADENAECIFLVQIPSYIASAFSYRNINTDIIMEEFSGYKVPTEAIRTGDAMNEYYVYATAGSETYKCECDVLYTDPNEGYSIIQSKEKAANKLSLMERLTVGER